MCGENKVFFLWAELEAGSPPRVRGKRVLLSLDGHRAGITPACAGKTYTDCPYTGHSKDHPRVCGENTGKQRADALQAGSPPRVRGKHRQTARRRPAGGITPACAGKTDI